MAPRRSPVLVMLAVAVSCRPAGTPEETQEEASSRKQDLTHSLERVSSDAAHPAEQLAELDHRQPVPLLPQMAWHQKQSMMDHLQTIQLILASLGSADWETASSAVERIQLQAGTEATCRHMGAGAGGFADLALSFHGSADRIADAIEEKDPLKAVAATSETLQVCVSCHARFRQEVVSPEEWAARTAADAPHHGPQH